MTGSEKHAKSRLYSITTLILIVGALVWLNISHRGELVFRESGLAITDPSTSLPLDGFVEKPEDARYGCIYTRRRIYGWPFRSFGVSDAVESKRGTWVPHRDSVNVYFWAGDDLKTTTAPWRSKLMVVLDIMVLIGLPVCLAFGLHRALFRRRR